MADNSDPTAIFLHGHYTHKGFFYNQMECSLLKNYRLISIDLPGYGESEKPMDPETVYSFSGFAKSVAMVVENLRLRNFVIIGWSLGGHVALEATSFKEI